MADKDSHKVYTYTNVDLDDKRPHDEKVEDFFDQLEDNLKN